MSLRVRVAAVVALAAIACAAMMAVLGTRIMRERIEDVAGSASMDVVSLLADDLMAAGFTPDALERDPTLRSRASRELEAHLARLNEVGSLWNNASILQPVDGGWRILARADMSATERAMRGVGDVVPMLEAGRFKRPSLDRAVSGWFGTDLNEWFGTAVPMRSIAADGTRLPATGVMSMTMHLEDAEGYWAEVLSLMLKALAAAVAIGVILGWWWAGLIIRPIETVRAFASALGRRQYTTRVEERGAPEMRRLLRDMNRLAEELSQRDARHVDGLASLAELRDHLETGAHVKRVSGVSLELLRGWQARHPIPAEEARIQQDILRLAAITHDLGKVGVEDAILKKPGKLDDAEYASMKRHTMLGAERIRGDDPYDAAAREVALHHHERWDGAGYPGRVDLAEASGDIARLLELPMPRTGLAGAEIPLFARIVSIADVFDALSSRRAYKEPWPEARILQAIRDDSGKAFDPELVDIFFERLDQVKAAWARHPDPTEAH